MVGCRVDGVGDVGELDIVYDVVVVGYWYGDVH